MTDTVPHTMVNAVTAERHVIQLRPKEGMTAADAQAFRAERIEEGKRIDPLAGFDSVPSHPPWPGRAALQLRFQAGRESISR
jgi:hypothetical protein